MGDYVANRKIYAKTLADIGEKNAKVVALDADVACSTGTGEFRDKFEERFFNMGAAEQNMMSAAAGMATCGLIPFASTFGIFASMRAGEQVRQSIAYTNCNVKIVVNNTGIENNGDGVTHQAIEDISIMRAMPNMSVIVPSDNQITEKAIRAMAEREGPVYMRIGRYDAPPVHRGEVEFEIGKMIEITKGKDLTIIAAGRMVEIAKKAVGVLNDKDFSVQLLDCHTIKPIDKQAIIEAAKSTGKIITCEDHSIIGGLGSAVCEVLAENECAIVRRIGVKDTFARSARDYRQLFDRYGLSVKSIVDAALNIMKQEKP